jgi:hypothetical protein
MQKRSVRHHTEVPTLGTPLSPNHFSTFGDLRIKMSACEG